MGDFTPFADDTTALAVGGLTIENGLTLISISGSLDISRDQTGLLHVEALKAVVDKLHQVLTNRQHPKDSASTNEVVRSTRRNPFS